MRVTFLLLMFTIGALAMSETATQAPAADEKKNPSKDESYDLKVTVRFWDGKKFINGVPNVPAFKYEKDGVVKFWTRRNVVTDGNPDKGSEIIVGDETWVVTGVEKGSAFTVSTVTKKPVEKKP